MPHLFFWLITDAAYYSVQSDEVDMGMTYDELTVFGRYVVTDFLWLCDLN